MGNKPILLVEDDRVDQMTVQRVLKELQLSNSLVIANDGEEGLKYLNNKDNEMPAIILLDLNMPKMNGIEFLNIIKKNNALKNIPVVVLTGSQNEQDTVDSFDLGVTGFMTKPVDSMQLSSFSLLLDSFSL